VKDRVATVGTAWLGLTLNCAECHTHKYDPITHEEYYRFYAFFNNSTDSGNYSLGPSVEVPKPDLADSEAHLARRLKEAQDDLARTEKELQSAQSAWEKSVARKPDPWRTLQLVNAHSTGGSGYTNLSDGSLLGTGVNPIYDTITVEARMAPAGGAPAATSSSTSFPSPRRPEMVRLRRTPTSSSPAPRPIGSSSTTGPSMPSTAIPRPVGPSVPVLENATSSSPDCKIRPDTGAEVV
jgi:hypothetical protein